MKPRSNLGRSGANPRARRRPNPRSELPPHEIVMKVIHGQLVPVRVFTNPEWMTTAGENQQVRVSPGGRAAGGLGRVIDNQTDATKKTEEP